MFDVLTNSMPVSVEDFEHRLRSKSHVASLTPWAAGPATGFGFEAIMAGPCRAEFRRWYDATSRLPKPGPAREQT